MSPNRQKHRDQYAKFSRVLSPFVSDPQVGLCKPLPWQVQPSDGFQVLQIITSPGRSKLEKRSEERMDWPLK
jgi:hypothetical protein